MGNTLPPALLFVGFFWYVFAAITTKTENREKENRQKPSIEAIF